MSTSKRRDALRIRLIDLARDQIAANGTSAVKARGLAAAAECSVGAIYNVFGDLDDLILAVNVSTFQTLGAQVQASVDPESSALDQMVAMAMAYLDFARAHPKLWRALFETNLTSDPSGAPDWYAAALDQLLENIDRPMAMLYPGIDQTTLRERTRTLFSAVHGIVFLGVEGRASAVSQDRLPEMIRFLLVSVATSRHFVNTVHEIS